MIPDGSNAVALDQNGLDGIVLGGLGSYRGDGEESVHCASLEWRESQAGGACMERLFEGQVRYGPSEDMPVNIYPGFLPMSAAWSLSVLEDAERHS